MFHYIDYRQVNNGGKAGFTLAANLLPGIPSSGAMLRKNGQRSGEGAISNWDRAIAFYRNDNGADTYLGGRTSDQGSDVKQTYPINLPTWLGTSVKNPGDFCAGLRAIYGEGEAGWLKFMESMRPMQPTKYGPMGDKETYGDSKRNTYLMAGKKFVGQDGVEHAAFPAADDCASTTFSHAAMGKGAWVLPDIDLLVSVLKTVKYGTSASMDADPVNAGLNAIGGSALSNSSYVWASSRYFAFNAWFSYGSNGFCGSSYLYYSFLALPLLLLDVREATNN